MSSSSTSPAPPMPELGSFHDNASFLAIALQQAHAPGASRRAHGLVSLRHLLAHLEVVADAKSRAHLLPTVREEIARLECTTTEAARSVDRAGGAASAAGAPGAAAASTAEAARRFEQMTARLGQAQRGAWRRGTAHLVLGTATVAAGLAVLGLAVHTPLPVSYPELAGQLAPRLGLAILTALTAFAFLRLHREALGDVRYFENELTNVESRQVAYEAAMRGACGKSRFHVLQALAELDRNLPLRKGETTVELERERMDSHFRSGLARQVGRLLERARPASGIDCGCKGRGTQAARA